MRSRTWTAPALILALALPASGAGATDDALRPEDAVSVIALEQRLLAVNPVTGPAAELDLELGERVLEVRSQGLLGIAVTDRRVLGISSGSATWVELRYRVHEREAAPPRRIHLTDRIALVQLPRRLVGLGSGLGAWQTTSIGPGEEIREVRSSARIASAVTSRRVIGFSRTSGFVEIGLSPREEVRSSTLDDRSATLVTSHRVLVFQDGSRAWTWLSD